MRKFLAAVVGVVGMATAAFAQDASIALPPELQFTYGECVKVSEDPAIADIENGICVTATRALMVSLVPAPPSDERDQKLTDLVIALAELPRPLRQQCEEYEDEIAEAIRIASTTTGNPDQAARFLEIADTLESCQSIQTAAIDQLIASNE